MILHKCWRCHKLEDSLSKYIFCPYCAVQYRDEDCVEMIIFNNFEDYKGIYCSGMSIISPTIKDIDDARIRVEKLFPISSGSYLRDIPLTNYLPPPIHRS